MWIGRGVSGSLLDVEARAAQSVVHATGGGTVLLKTTSIPLQLALHGTLADVYCYLPIVYKQKMSDGGASGNKMDQAAGIGDVSLSVLKRLGMEGAHGVTLGLALPAGKSDIHDFGHKLVSSDVQNGSGTFSLNLQYDYTVTRDWGLFIFGAAYAPGLMYLQTVSERWDSDLGRLVPGTRRPAVARVNVTSSRNDMGVVSPDYLSLHAYTGVRQPKLTHSFGLNGSIPLGKATFTEYDYVVKPENKALVSKFPEGGAALLDDFGYPPPNDTVNYHFAKVDSVWVVRQETVRREYRWFTLTPSYGLELYNDVLPVFMAFSLPVEFNGKTGVGVKGFSLELGIKLGLL
jgi:hypothetical protein